MKYYRLPWIFLILLLPCYVNAGGFFAGTLVKTSSGYVPIETLSVGDHVVCMDYEYGLVE